MLQLAIETGLRVSELTGLRSPTRIPGSPRTSHATAKDAKTNHTNDKPPPKSFANGYGTRRTTNDPIFRPARAPAHPRRGRSSTRPTAKTARGTAVTEQQEHHPTCAPAQPRRCVYFRAASTTSVIALWLGHENVETTLILLHADLAIKKPRSPDQATKVRRELQAADKLLAFLEGL